MTEFNVPKLGEIALTGESGQTYTFTVYTRETDFYALGAVYLMSKRTSKLGGEGATHAFIYIGQTGDLSDRPLNHHKTECFDKHGANCVSVYLESDEKKRFAVETDLVRKNKPPCND